ncbi:MAG TPA: hypothetical protein VF624_15560, partial [Tepidisphaeraceae bacterium]
MSRELRLNLIFLVILLMLMAPGFYILMRKRLADTDRRADLPHPPPHSVAYVQPGPVPPHLPRVEPSAAKVWVSRLVRDRFGAEMFRAEGNVPCISGDHRAQLTYFAADAGRLRLQLLLWQAPEAAGAR